MLIVLDRAVSGNCWRARLMLALASKSFHRIEVDITAGEQNDPAFRALNPRGELPVLIDANPDGKPTVVWDSVAIMAYVAARFAPHYLAEAPVARGLEQQWLAVAGAEHQRGLRAARAATLYGIKTPGVTLEEARTTGRRALVMMNDHLVTSQYLSGENVTIADIACYTYAKVAPEAKIETGDLTAMQAWIGRVEALPGYAAIDAPSGGESTDWAGRDALFVRAGLGA